MRNVDRKFIDLEFKFEEFPSFTLLHATERAWPLVLGPAMHLAKPRDRRLAQRSLAFRRSACSSDCGNIEIGVQHAHVRAGDVKCWLATRVERGGLTAVHVTGVIRHGDTEYVLHRSRLELRELLRLDRARVGYEKQLSALHGHAARRFGELTVRADDCADSDVPPYSSGGR